jgi:hypothetical protein
MLVGKNKLGNSSAKVYGPSAVATRKSSPKTPGTRAGTLEDWREGSKKSGKNSGGRRNRLRDGR